MVWFFFIIECFYLTLDSISVLKLDIKIKEVTAIFKMIIFPSVSFSNQSIHVIVGYLKRLLLIYTIIYVQWIYSNLDYLF